MFYSFEMKTLSSYWSNRVCLQSVDRAVYKSHTQYQTNGSDEIKIGQNEKQSLHLKASFTEEINTAISEVEQKLNPLEQFVESKKPEKERVWEC